MDVAGGTGIHRVLNQPTQQRPGQVYKAKVNDKKDDLFSEECFFSCDV